MATPKENIPTKAYTATEVIPVRAGMKFVASVAGDGSLQFNDGTGTWADYPDSGASFGGWVNPQASVRINVNSGTVTFGLVEVIENDA